MTIVPSDLLMTSKFQKSVTPESPDANQLPSTSLMGQRLGASSAFSNLYCLQLAKDEMKTFPAAPGLTTNHLNCAPQGPFLDEPFDEDTVAYIRCGQKLDRHLKDSELSTDPFVFTMEQLGPSRQATSSPAGPSRQVTDPLPLPSRQLSAFSSRQVSGGSDWDDAWWLTPSSSPPMTAEDTEALAASTEGFTPTAYKKLPTTLMIRNIPQLYTQEDLALEWPNNGTYDFFYMPISFKGNKTYAFINFTTPESALAFKEKWDKKRLRRFQARRTLNISCADVQGQDANLWQLRKGQQWRLKNKECQPLIFDKKGRQISLDYAMRTLRQPVSRQGAADAVWSL